VDISPAMILKAREALRDVPNAELLLTEGDLSAIENGTLDFVYSFIVFQHIPSKRIISNYIREAARTLKVGGVFRFQVDGRPRPWFSSVDTWRGVWYRPDELRAKLLRLGFEVASVWGEDTHYLWVTAIRSAKQASPVSSAVRVALRNWNEPAVREFLTRIGSLEPGAVDKILGGQVSLRKLSNEFFQRQETAQPEAFVRAAYAAILGRQPDAEGLAFYVREIESGVAPSNTIDCLMASQELEDNLRPLSRITPPR
jgi:hypothetical protein